jgi:putative addiction module killer protein
MYTIQQTQIFAKWLTALRDARAKAAIILRLDRVRAGHLGDVKTLGNGVFELRVEVGPGYRLYFTRRGISVILLLVGGDKSSPTRDIKRAKQLAKEC